MATCRKSRQENPHRRERRVWLALAATVPFSRLSCGYVGKATAGRTSPSLSDGLGVRPGRGWEHRPHRRTGPRRSPGVHDGARVRRRAAQRGHDACWSPSPFPSGNSGSGSRSSGTEPAGASCRSKRRRPTAGTSITGATASFSPRRQDVSRSLHRLAVHPVGGVEG